MSRSIAAVAGVGPLEAEFVLFDLGGVLIDPGGVGPLRALSGVGTDEELWARWLGCPWVRRFEAGACTPEEFAAGFVDDWGLALTPAAFLEEFGRWPGVEYAGAAELVTDVRRSLDGGTGFLSNANAYQWETRFGVLDLTSLASACFDYRFLSFELGMVKPDPEIFAAVSARLPVGAPKVLFLDDNAVNVEAARAAGFAARRVRGPSEARAALEEAGVLAR